jgi:hypothetical protein
MSKVGRSLRASLYGTAAAFSIGVLRAPESMRGHLPAPIDIASTVSNFLPCFALGVGIMATQKGAERIQRLSATAASLAIAVAANIAVETDILQRYGLADDLLPLIGSGAHGELRDAVWGIGGALLGSLAMWRSSARPSSDLAVIVDDLS